MCALVPSLDNPYNQVVALNSLNIGFGYIRVTFFKSFGNSQYAYLYVIFMEPGLFACTEFSESSGIRTRMNRQLSNDKRYRIPCVERPTKELWQWDIRRVGSILSMCMLLKHLKRWEDDWAWSTTWRRSQRIQWDSWSTEKIENPHLHERGFIRMI